MRILTRKQHQLHVAINTLALRRTIKENLFLIGHKLAIIFHHLLHFYKHRYWGPEPTLPHRMAPFQYANYVVRPFDEYHFRHMQILQKFKSITPSACTPKANGQYIIDYWSGNKHSCLVPKYLLWDCETISSTNNQKLTYLYSSTQSQQAQPLRFRPPCR